MGAVHAALRDEGGLLADVLAAAPSRDGHMGARVVAGPRAAGREAALAFVVEAVREGELLHYGSPRLFERIDPDLALLAGDRLFALGLARLAEVGDLEAVAELADVISLCAQARTDGREDLSDAIWQAGIAAIGWGGSDALRAAKAAARAGEPRAGEALRAAARQITGARALAR